MPILPPETIIAAVSAVMQGIQTWIAYRDSKRTADVVKKTYSRVITKEVTRRETDRLVSLVPPNILEQMIKRVNNCWINYQDVIESAGEYLPNEIDEATEAVKKCICRELRRIYSLNQSIPDGTLREWWNAYCDRRN